MLAALLMAATMLVAGPTSADAHQSETCSVPAPAATGLLADALSLANVFSTFVHTDSAECVLKGEGVAVAMDRDWGDDSSPDTFAPCVQGMAADYFPCDGVDLMSHLSMTELGIGLGDVPAGVNDIWGWTDYDPLKGGPRDYALLGSDEGTVFVDITDNKRPVVLGMLPTASGDGSDGWRDIKVYEDHAFVVSENNNHGVQVFDLTRLRDWDGEYTTYDVDAHYTGMGSAHNIAINEDTGYAYALGSGDFWSQGLPHTIAVDGGSSFLATGATFGPRPTEAGIDAPFFDTGSIACNGMPLPDLTGTIAIVDRGGCFFSDKVLNTQNAGAVATIIVSTADSYLTMAPGPSGEFVTIPSFFLASSVGAALRAELPGTGSVFANDPPPACGDGLHMIDISDPTNPTFAGCESETGYVHDTQCVVYDGPDADYQGREICFNSNGISGSFDPAANWFSIVDVTDKANPVVLSRVNYAGSVYSHQGWLTEDQAFFLFGDELDEVGYGVGTSTRVWDVSDLTDPFVANIFENTTTAIDHNLYVQGDYAYASNYMSGLRIYDASDPANGLSEVAWFDMYPESDDASFAGGTWSNYPYFHQKGIVAVSSVDQGLFILRPRVDRSGN